ncbi:MAG: DNA polymerase III subunit delta [Solirubrobacteraceae bacterium]
MAAFKSAYLIHGDDHGRVAERRARLRALAEATSGTHGIEVFEGEAATPEAVAAALNAMTFAMGRRFLIVDGAERWKDKELDELETSLGGIPADTTVAFFAREDGRMKAPGRLHKAVTQAGGDIAAEETLKAWELPKWLGDRARELGLELEPGAAQLLIDHVGERQQRLLRELEKLALEKGPGGRIETGEIESVTAASAERKAWSLADALLAGEPGPAIRLYLTLRAQGERVPGLLYWMGQRLRQAHEVAVAIEAGQPPAQVRKRLRMPSRAADRLLADARNAGSERLRAALEELADLELASRGGGKGGAGEDTSALLAIRRIAG